MSILRCRHGAMLMEAHRLDPYFKKNGVHLVYDVGMLRMAIDVRALKKCEVGLYFYEHALVELTAHTGAVAEILFRKREEADYFVSCFKEMHSNFFTGK